MIKNQQIEQVRHRSEKVYANGKLLDYTLYADIYQKDRRKLPEPQYENKYNPVQNFLIKRALYGLSIYNKQELVEMEPSLKRKIYKLSKKANKEITLLKQNKVIKKSNLIFSLFPRSPLAKAILDDDFIDPSLNNRFGFKDIGLRKEDVVDCLHAAGILPKNFYESKAR